MSKESKIPKSYDLRRCLPGDLTAAEMARCLELLEEGKAVNVERAKKDLPRSPLMVVVRHDGNIVGLGANKGIREWYAEQMADAAHSGFDFPRDTPEIGYIVVEPNHRGNHLSTRIVAALLEKSWGPLFATTDKPEMRAVLQKAGFLHKGSAWGRRGQLSLWIRATTTKATRGDSQTANS